MALHVAPRERRIQWNNGVLSAMQADSLLRRQAPDGIDHTGQAKKQPQKDLDPNAARRVKVGHGNTAAARAESPFVYVPLCFSYVPLPYAFRKQNEPIRAMRAVDLFP